MAKLKGPARDITNAGSGKIVGLFPSQKNAAPIPYESLHERDCFLLFEYSKSIVAYVAQPVTIKIWINGKSRLYTPDALVHRTDKSRGYVEVKTDEVAELEESKTLFEAATAYFEKESADYRVVTTTHLRRGFLIDNIRLLYRFVAWPIAPSEREQTLRHLESSGPVSLGVLRDRMEAEGIGIAAIYRLLFEQEIAADLVGQRVGHMLQIWRGAV